MLLQSLRMSSEYHFHPQIPKSRQARPQNSGTRVCMKAGPLAFCGFYVWAKWGRKYRVMLTVVTVRDYKM